MIELYTRWSGYTENVVLSFAQGGHGKGDYRKHSSTRCCLSCYLRVSTQKKRRGTSKAEGKIYIRVQDGEELGIFRGHVACMWLLRGENGGEISSNHIIEN